MEKLRPQQRELLVRVFWDEVKQSDIARQEGVRETAVSERMQRIYRRLETFLPDKKNFF